MNHSQRYRDYPDKDYDSLVTCSGVPDEMMHLYETLKADVARSGTSRLY
jgi:hypothetical protein